MWVVEFSSGGTKSEKNLSKNQHTKRKLLNFENWCNEGCQKLGIILGNIKKSNNVKTKKMCSQNDILQ